jgi:transcriptional regulator with PAS, ATPase and Fis domain
LKETYEREERQALLDAYRQTGSTRKTAGILRVSQPTVVKKMKKYGIAVEGFNGKEGVIHEGIAVSEP